MPTELTDQQLAELKEMYQAAFPAGEEAAYGVVREAMALIGIRGDEYIKMIENSINGQQ